MNDTFTAISRRQVAQSSSYRLVIEKGVNTSVNTAEIDAPFAHRCLNQGWKRLVNKFAVGFSTADKGDVAPVKPLPRSAKKQP